MSDQNPIEEPIDPIEEEQTEEVQPKEYDDVIPGDPSDPPNG